MIGQTVSHYKIIEQIGAGGMGLVYKAEDAKLKRLVALKFLPSELTRDAEAKTRFLHEARAASALDHPNICTIHEIEETQDGRLFIVMGYYEGETLKEKIHPPYRPPLSRGERGGIPLSIKTTLDIAVQVARGLSKAHQRGIVHRDIKPANILITVDNAVKIVDFGLAKLGQQTRLTTEGTTLGTVSYMSPEQARGEEADQRSDIWSLGVTLYEMLTGQLPFQGEYDQAVLYSIIHEEPEPPGSLRSGIPPELERVVLKMLAKDPAKRYQHVDDLLVDLNNIRESSEKEIRTDFKSANNAAKISGKKIAIAAALLGFLTAAFFLGKYFFLTPPTTAPKPIAVISFENQTGDPAYNYLQKAIPNLLISKLEESNCLRVTSWERMHDLLKQMGKQDAETIDPKLGFELCRMDSINTIVLGSFTKAGDMFATDVKVLDVITKKLIKTASSRGEGIASILKKQIDELSDKIIEGMNIPVAESPAHTTSVAELTTASMKAYNYFLKARDAYYNLYRKESQALCRKALTYDSTFARAYFILAMASDDGSPQERDALIKAKQYAYKAGKWRYLIDGVYATGIERNPQTAYASFLQMTQRYPKEKLGYLALGLYFDNSERFEEARKVLEKAVALDPNYTFGLNYLGYTYLNLGEFDKALKTFKRYMQILPNTANPYDSMGDLYYVTGNLEAAISNYRQALVFKPDFSSSSKLSYLYALKEDYPQAMQWIRHYIDKSSSPNKKARGLILKGFYLLWSGRFNTSLETLDKALLSAKTGVSDFGKTCPLLLKAWLYYTKGDLPSGYRFLTDWYRVSKSARSFYSAVYDLSMGYFLIKEEKIDSARARLENIKTVLPRLNKRLETPLANYYAQLLQAEIDLAEGQPDKVLKTAGHMRLSAIRNEPTVFHLVFLNLPVFKDVQARAFLATGKTDRAIAEYEAMMLPGADGQPLQLIHPVYHYRLARLYEQKGWPGKAMEQYEIFLSICKDADKGIEEVVKARERLRKLRKEKPNP